MKKTALIAAPLALAASLALAPAASAAPAYTPARACLQVVDLKNPPVGTNFDAINQAAKALGLPGVPTAVGGVCNTAVPTDADSGTTEYPRPGHGPVILRTSAYARYQQYCTDSVSVVGTGTIPGTNIPAVDGLIVFGSDCTSEPNPLIV
ncbi:hypothetical protein [Kitasatospora sp. GP82]|uniref:hypothetical protein n=1 Tax=Kitasatospora sp. GP82 TaxID=3035089 RepID=UPI00247568D5|nr:hypothetical protein [Kitasatospora sp. GP82]MDH6129733.1 hypothetical protein [Kitasatospora sp. GP82]